MPNLNKPKSFFELLILAGVAPVLYALSFFIPIHLLREIQWIIILLVYLSYFYFLSKAIILISQSKAYINIVMVIFSILSIGFLTLGLIISVFPHKYFVKHCKDYDILFGGASFYKFKENSYIESSQLKYNNGFDYLDFVACKNSTSKKTTSCDKNVVLIKRDQIDDLYVLYQGNFPTDSQLKWNFDDSYIDKLYKCLRAENVIMIDNENWVKNSFNERAIRYDNVKDKFYKY